MACDGGAVVRAAHRGYGQPAIHVWDIYDAIPPSGYKWDVYNIVPNYWHDNYYDYDSVITIPYDQGYYVSGNLPPNLIDKQSGYFVLQSYGAIALEEITDSITLPVLRNVVVGAEPGTNVKKCYYIHSSLISKGANGLLLNEGRNGSVEVFTISPRHAKGDATGNSVYSMNPGEYPQNGFIEENQLWYVYVSVDLDYSKGGATGQTVKSFYSSKYPLKGYDAETGKWYERR